MKSSLLRLAILGLFAFASAPALATPKGPELQTRLIALLIGINQYQDTNITPLKYANRDIHTITRTLQTYSGGKSSNIKALTGVHATKANLEKHIKDWLFQQASSEIQKGVKPRDVTVMVYYSGHGFAANKSSYWLPRDANSVSQETLIESSIDIALVQATIQSLRNLGIMRILLITDACNSGFSWTEGQKSIDLIQNKQKIQAGFRKALNLPDFLQKSSGGGLVTISSSTQDQYSVESKRLKHGVFSYLFDRALKGAADFNRDGVVTLQELWLYLSQEVTPLAKKEMDYEQIPVKTGPEAGAFPLSFPKLSSLSPASQPALVLSDKSQKVATSGLDGQVDGDVAPPRAWKRFELTLLGGGGTGGGASLSFAWRFIPLLSLYAVGGFNYGSLGGATVILRETSFGFAAAGLQLVLGESFRFLLRAAPGVAFLTNAAGSTLAGFALTAGTGVQYLFASGLFLGATFEVVWSPVDTLSLLLGGYLNLGFAF